MLNEKYLPSLGFLILLFMIIGSGLFVKWASGPLSYEKALIFEKEAHKYFKEKRYKEAFLYFLKSAKIKDNNKTRSYRYRCVGTVLVEQKKYRKSIEFYEKALKYNPNNKLARDALNWMQNTNKIGKIND